MQSFVTFSHTVSAHVGCPKTFWDTGPRRKIAGKMTISILSYQIWPFYPIVRAYVRRTPRLPPFDVIGTVTDRSDTCDFLLVIHSNHRSISCRFRDKGRFRSKIAPTHPIHFTHPLRRFPLEFCEAGGSENIRMILLKDGGKRRWTNGQTNNFTVNGCLSCVIMPPPP